MIKIVFALVCLLLASVCMYCAVTTHDGMTSVAAFVFFVMFAGLGFILGGARDPK